MKDDSIREAARDLLATAEGMTAALAAVAFGLWQACQLLAAAIAAITAAIGL